MLAVVDVVWTKSDNRREVAMYIHEVKGITRRSHKTRRGEQYKVERESRKSEIIRRVVEMGRLFKVRA